MDAVKADPAAADLASINAYAPSRYESLDEKSRADQAEQQRVDKSKARQAAALRQYVRLRPADWAATETLIFLVDLPEADALLQPFFKSRPRDPELYTTRAILRSQHGLYSASLDDYMKAGELDPQNAERYYRAGALSYEAITKDKSLTETAKRDLIKRGLAALDRAEALEVDYVESLGYRIGLLRQQALLEGDPKVRKKLTAEADALHQRAMEIIKRRRAAKQNP
jgi:tetratricopeptide (TPR) repeat protein